MTSACGTTSGGGGDDGTGPGGGGGGGGGTGGGGGGTGGGGTGGGGGTSVSPRAGAWEYGELTPVSSTCSAALQHGEAGPFAVDQVGTASFRITPGDGLPPFTCTSSGAQFSCPNRATFVMDSRPSADAVITVHATVTGVFTDRDSGTGKQEATVDCTGSQCGLVGPLPCTFRVNFEIHSL